MLRCDSHISAMRARYDSNGGQLRLCAESKKMLNLMEPSQWRLDNLISVQPRVIAPLMKYWYHIYLLIYLYSLVHCRFITRSTPVLRI